MVCIDAHKGKDVQGCLNHTHCCESLEYVAKELQQVSRLSVRIESDITVTGIVPFSETTSLEIIGAYVNIVVTCASTTRSGFYFGESNNILVKYLTFDTCSTLQNSTSQNSSDPGSNLLFPSGLYFINCTNVTLQSLTVRNTPGKGLVLYDCNGVVEISDTVFLNNTLPNDFGGGGVYIEFSRCSPSSEEECSEPRENSFSQYLLKNCTFENNGAFTTPQDESLFVRSTGLNFQGFGRGGGLCIFLRGRSNANKFEVVDCTFLANSANRGGGLYIAFKDEARNNTMYIYNSTVDSNISNDVGGGGVQLGFLSYDQNEPGQLTENQILFEDTYFVRNSAFNLGGGVYIISSRDYSRAVSSNIIRFTQCTWVDNKALLASAVDISPSVWDLLTQGSLPTPEFIDCAFVNNTVLSRTLQLADGIWQNVTKRGVFMVTNFEVSFSGRIEFENNQGSALVLITSRAILKANSSVRFIRNSGVTGGALFMKAFSILLVHTSTVLEFTRNVATSKGGAIYAESIDIHEHSNSRSCFIQSSDHSNNITSRNITLIFDQNTALSNEGNVIFATSFVPCARSCHSDSNISSILVKAFGCIGRVVSKNHLEDFDISSSVHKFQLKSVSRLQAPIIPGSRHQIPLLAFDELNQKKNNVNYKVSVFPNSTSLYAMSVSRSRVQLQGQPHSSGKLVFSKGSLSVTINVSLSPCPPGFVLSHDNECECRSLDFRGIWKCRSFSRRAHVLQGFWVGECSDGQLCTAACPRDYCVYQRNGKRDYLLPKTVSELDEYMCGPTRTGVLCGECRSSYTVHFHSYTFKCGDVDSCNLGILLYIVLEILPITVFFVVVLVFNVRFTSGAINGFIVFAQIIETLNIRGDDIIQLSPGLSRFSFVNRIIYRVFGMDFFTHDSLSFCLWRGATTLDILSIKYITVLYALGLIIVTIGVLNTRTCQRCLISCVPRSLKSSVINGLTTFFVMCYSQIARTSFYLLSSTHLLGQGLVKKEFVVFRNGNLMFFRGDHLKYAVPAFTFLATLVCIPPIVLMMYPAVYKLLGRCGLGESKLANCLSSHVPMELLDSFQGCFKDKYRFFAGFYFLYRVLPYVFQLFTRTNLMQYYVLIQIWLILMLALHSILQPYRVSWHNAIDTLLFIDLALINTLSMYNFERATEIQDTLDESSVLKTDITLTVQVVVMFLPIVYLFGFLLQFVVCKVVKKCRERRAKLATVGYAEILLDSHELPPLRDELDESQYREYAGN